MFEHLDDDAAPRPPEHGAAAARREARYRRNRRTGIVATSFMLLGALLAVAVRENTPPQVGIQTAGAGKSTTTVASNGDAPSTSKVRTGGTAPRNDRGTHSEPGRDGNGGTANAGNPAGTGDPGAGPNELGSTAPGNGPNTGTNGGNGNGGGSDPSDTGIVEWLATPAVATSGSGSNVYLDFELEIRNGTGETQHYLIDWCDDQIRRFKYDTSTHVLTPDYANCLGSNGPEAIEVPAHSSFFRTQRARIQAGDGAIPNGTWDVVMYDKFHVSLTITGSPR